MYFDRIRGAAAAILCVALLVAPSGCGLKFGGHPDQGSTVELGSATTACLSGASQTLLDYLAGSAKPDRIRGLYSCAINALDLFQSRTWGASNPGGGSYTPEELRKFLEHYFFHDFTISDALMRETMELKRTLLGGTTEVLTPDELTRARQLMGNLSDISVNLQPFMPLTPSRAKAFSPQNFQAAISTLQSSAVALGQILSANSTPYRFSHLDELLEEIEKVLSDDQYISDVAEMRQYLPLFQELKKVFVSPDDQEMAGNDWPVLMTRAASAYSLLLRYSYLSTNEATMVSGTGRIEFTALAQDVVKLIDDVVNGQTFITSDGTVVSTGTLSYCNLYSLIDEIYGLFGDHLDLTTLKQSGFKGYPINLQKYLTDNISENDEDYLWYLPIGKWQFFRGSVKQFLQPLTQTFLRPLKDPTQVVATHNGTRFADFWNACGKLDSLNHAPVGLRAENVDRLWDLVSVISEGQGFLEKNFQWAQTADDTPGDPLTSQFLPSVLNGWIASFTGWYPDVTILPAALSDLYGVPASALEPATVFAAGTLAGIAQSHVPLFVSGDSQIQLDYYVTPVAPVSGQPPLWKQSFVGLSAYGAIRQLVRWVWQGYATDPSQVDGVDANCASTHGSSGGMTVDQIVQFYVDTNEIGVAVLFYDPTSADAANKRFLESNLFTYMANGDHYMSINEGADEVSFLFSAKELSSTTYKRVSSICSSVPGAIGGTDVYGNSKISVGCFHQNTFGDPDLKMWDHMPNLAKYYRSLPTLGAAAPVSGTVYRETVRCMLETVARGTGMDPNWIDSGDVDVLSALYHYLEAVFIRFDQGKKGLINLADAEAAFPVFDQTLKDKASLLGLSSYIQSDADAEAALTFILAQGEIPSWSNPASIAAYAVWRYISFSDFIADRARVLQVMGLVTDSDVTPCLAKPTLTGGGWTPAPVPSPSPSASPSPAPSPSPSPSGGACTPPPVAQI